MVFFTPVEFHLGEIGLVWQFYVDAPLLIRVLMPDGQRTFLSQLRQLYPEARSRSHPTIDVICRQLERYDQGKDIAFSVPEVGPQPWSNFYRRVWTETAKIPRGKVSTYGQVANKISNPRAARAVGTALAKNPFPLLIPCHRVIQSSGELGNYSAGGPTVKRHLLVREGVLFDCQGRVMVPKESINN